ncbi:actin-like ATPase domain-containing protein [Rhizopogon vinicolor AM-OR11-026]|uniref:Actin-like ATPase domain-containing protein n=1 Tax=Rhizopogon vinicolor AM-OR11-026 TaxID=1314800 RepID=A0A1B7MQD5_9AGAM|nr:actin-like ATPase domain-containing protein [Rhizopogon vinicolor AM-OR11-026]
MPPGPKTGPALFLGLELATDQLRASIVDESLELVGVECVDFDTELPEFQTQGGIFTTPGDAYTTPVDMWVKALDFLLEKLSRNHDVTRIKSIGGCAQHAVVWWKSTPIPSFPALDPRLPFHSQLPTNTFSLPNTPIAQDTSAHTHALALEALLGGPDLMAARVGTCANASLLAAQLLRVRESWTSDVWSRTGKIQLASQFMASMIMGEWVNMGEAEACATGMWVHTGPGAQGASGLGRWDEGVLEIVGGNREEGRRIRTWLGDVEIAGGRKAAHISRYLCERYGFESDTIVTPFTSDYLSAYLSLCPSPGDAVLSFGPMDTLLTPAQHYLPTRLYSLFPHPAQDACEKRRYIAMLTSRNADVPRALVRDMYTKSWSAFDRLVAIVPPGGSIGLDDKLFSFWLLQGDSYPLSHVKGIYRFETGIKVNEFRDLRANPRCLLESQVLSFRFRWSRMIATGVLGSNINRSRGNVAQTPSPPTPQGQSSRSNIASSLGLSFDPYDYSTLPTRILVTGAAANFPSVANLAGDVFNAPVFMPSTQVDSAQVVPHRNAPATGFPGRASLGGAYFARWIWGKERSSAVGGSSAGRGLGGFEEEIRRLHGKRWVASSATPLRTNVNAPAGGNGGSGANSGTSTPYGHRSGLGSTVFVEEDEEEVEEMERSGGTLSSSFFVGGFADRDLGRDISRMRTLTGSTLDSVTSGGSLGAPSSAFTTPDPNASAGSPGGGVAGVVVPSTTTLTPVTAMPTSDAEAQIGLAKVAEADVDAFMTYAAIVPEYCRLEGMLCKSLV